MRITYVSCCLGLGVAVLVLSGCKAPGVAMDDVARREMLALLMPSRVEIVQPFTRVKQFDGDSNAQGIELLLQAANSLGDAGLMIAGDVRIELYEHVPASGNPRGRRVESWDVRIATKGDQRTYWNQVSQMYEFRLGVTHATLVAATQFVLRVTYNSPLGDHLTDECIIRRPETAAVFGAGG